MMIYKAIILLIIGLLIIIFPQHIRKYKAFELKQKPKQEFIAIQRITGALFIIISILVMIL